MGSRQVSVLIVDDSQVSRDMLDYIIGQDNQLKVIGFAKDGEEAINWLREHSVDVITMDILMPGINGFEVTRRIMETKPIPIVIVSAAYSSKNAAQGFQAMEAGALAILEKPQGLRDERYAQMAKEIVQTIKTVAEVKLVRRRARQKELGRVDVKIEKASRESIEAIAIGTSLGGPMALASLLKALPAHFPVPIYIVQHISSGFTEGLVQWLQGFTQISVRLATDREQGQPGHCYIAPGGCHMEVTKGGVIVLDRLSKDPLKPSVARLFRSMAQTYRSHCVGVLLTGMGRDGAEELLLMRQNGAYTIAQDEESSLMFGMPREAIAIGAAQSVLPLSQIAGTLVQLIPLVENSKTSYS